MITQIEIDKCRGVIEKIKKGDSCFNLGKQNLIPFFKKLLTRPTSRKLIFWFMDLRDKHIRINFEYGCGTIAIGYPKMTIRLGVPISDNEPIRKKMFPLFLILAHELIHCYHTS